MINSFACGFHAGYAMQIENGIQRVKDAIPRLYQIPLGGTAIGTGLNARKGYAEKAVAKIAQFTCLPFIPSVNKFEAQSAHDAVVELHGALNTVAVSIMKVRTCSDTCYNHIQCTFFKIFPTTLCSTNISCVCTVHRSPMTLGSSEVDPDVVSGS